MTPPAVSPLATAVDTLELGVDDRDLAVVLAARDRLDARLAAAVRAVDAAELWDTAGTTSMTAWVAEHGRMARPRAARLVKVARLVGRLPVTEAAWQEGRLSTGQVEVICAFLKLSLVEVFARCEAAMVPVLEPLTVPEVAVAMRAWRDALDDDDPPPERPDELHASRLLDDRVRVDANLSGDNGELLLTALRVAEQAATGEAPAEGESGILGRTPATRRADALGDICRFFLDHQTTVPDGGRHRPHLNVVVHLAPTTSTGQGHGDDGDGDGDGDSACQGSGPTDGPDDCLIFDIARARTVDGHPLDRVTARRYLCDSLLHRVFVDSDSVVLDYGRTTRAVAASLWNALLLRDTSCRFKGCDRPGHWSEAHHVVPWERGGETKLANLVVLCSRHHHIVHRPGWHATLAPDGTFQVTDPWGTTRTTRPPGAGPPLPFAA